jgi:hypothetical protein
VWFIRVLSFAIAEETPLLTFLPSGMVPDQANEFEELKTTLTTENWIDTMYQEWATPVLRGFCCQAFAEVDWNDDSIEKLYPIVDKIIENPGTCPAHLVAPHRATDSCFCVPRFQSLSRSCLVAWEAVKHY